MKKWIARLLTLVMVLGLCACDRAPETPEEVLAAAAEKMQNTGSASFSTEIRLGVESQGIELPLIITGEGEMMTDPQIVHTTMTLDMVIAKLTMEFYSQVSGNTVTSYVGMDVGEGIEWMKNVTEVPENPAISESMKMISNLVEAQEPVEIDGIQATRYEGRITGQDIRKAVEAVLGGMAGTMDEETSRAMDEIFQALDDETVLPVTYCVDRETLNVLEISMDMTDFLQSILALPELQEAGIGVSYLTVTLGYSGFDTIESIEIPQEALDAPEA